MNRNRKPIVKWIRGVCSGLLMVLAVLLVAAPVAVNSHAFQQWLARRINTAINGELSWKSLRVSLFSGRVSAGQVLLTDKAGRKIVHVAHLETAISWPRLFQGMLRLEPVILEKPQIRLEIRSDGAVNIVHAFESPHPAPETPPKTSSGITVILRAVRLSQGRVDLSLPDDDINITAQEVGISGAADFSKSAAAVVLSAARLRYRGPGIARDLCGLQLRASLDGQKLKLQTFRLRSAFSRLKISGRIDDLFDIPRFKLSGQLESQLAEIGQFLDVQPQPAGVVTLSMAVDGPLDNPRATLKMRYAGGKLWGRKVTGAALRLKLADLKLSLDGSATDTASGKITLAGSVDLDRAFAGRRLTATLHTARIAYRYAISASNLDLAGLLPQMPGLTGCLTATVQGAGSGLSMRNMDGDLSLQGQLKQIQDGRFTAPVDLRLSGRAAVKKGFLKVSALSIRAGGTVLEGRAGFDLRRREGTAGIEVAAADLSRDLSWLGIEGISGSLDGRISVAGSLTKPRFAISLEGRRLAAGRVKVGNLKVKAHMGHQGILQVSAFTIENGPSRIGARGRVPIYDMLSGKEMRSDLQLTATLAHVDARNFVADLPFSGIFSGHLSASGRLPQLSARAVLAGRGLKSAGVQAGDLDAELRLKNGELFLDRLRVYRGESEIRARGHARLLRQKRLALVEDPAFELRVESRRLDLVDFTGRVDGKVNLEADLKGTFRHPTGTLRMKAQNLAAGVQKIARLQLQAKVADDVLQVKNLTITPVAGQQIRGCGRIARNGDYAITLVGEGLSLDAVDWLRRRRLVGGDVSLQIAGRGSLKNPQLRADIRVASTRIARKPFQDIVAALTLRDYKLHFEGQLGFDVQADYDLKSRKFAVQTAFEHTKLGPYLRLAGLAGWTGSLTGQLSGKGRFGALDAMTAVLELGDAYVFYHGRQVLTGRQLSLDYRRGRIDFRSVELELLEKGKLSIRGRAALDGPLKIRMAGNLPIAALQVFSGTFGNPVGQLKLNARVGGVVDAPDVSGTIDLQGIGAIVPGLDQRLHDLTGQIVFTRQRIDFKKIKALLGSGRLFLNGRVDMKGLEPVAAALKLKARGLAIEPVQDVQAVLDADLSLTGSAAKSLLSGRVELAEGYYERDVNLSLLKIAGKELASLGKKQPVFRAPRQKLRRIDIPFAENMRLNVDFSTRRPLVVDNDLAEMEVSADLKLKGSVARPSISGRAAVNEGTITFQGQAFKVTRGVIDFVNPYRIEPNLDIRSVGQVANYRITLTLQGPMSQLDLKLSSDPALPDADILSLILFGRTTAELGKGGGVSGADIAAGLVSSSLGGKVKKKTGLDTLQAEAMPTGEDGGNATAPVRITVGKNLNRRLFAKYQFTIGGDESIRRTVVDYKLLENLMVSVYQESTDAFGGMIKYRLEFR